MRATGAFTDVFQLPGLEIDPRMPGMIERDRVIMAARPGMIRKLLPLRVDRNGVFSGGCYLFDTRADAQGFGDWVEDEFVLDGTKFFDRPVFMEPSAQAWDVVGVEDIADVHTAQHLMRFERWHTMTPAEPGELRERWWPRIVAGAREAGCTGVWLLVDPDAHHPQVGLVTVTARTEGGAEADGPPALTPLETEPSLGADLAGELHATKVFDRASWVYMVWFPIVDGVLEGTALWPNSPPLPGMASHPVAAGHATGSVRRS
jgi:hypothetical protein